MKKSMKRIASVIHFTENDTETERYLHLWQLRLGFEHEYWIHGREEKYGFKAKPQTPSHKTINEIPLNFAHTHTSKCVISSDSNIRPVRKKTIEINNNNKKVKIEKVRNSETEIAACDYLLCSIPSQPLWVCLFINCTVCVCRKKCHLISTLDFFLLSFK